MGTEEKSNKYKREMIISLKKKKKRFFMAIIGGFSFYEFPYHFLFKKRHSFYPKTPYGFPSSEIEIWEFKEKKKAYLVFLNRYSKTHQFLAEDIPHRAHIYILKRLKVQLIISLDFLGSLNDQYKLGDFVLTDQLIDLTSNKNISFLPKGIAGGAEFLDPFSEKYRQFFYKHILKTHKSTETNIHNKGTLFIIEGTSYPTQAETALYRSWGADFLVHAIGAEAKLSKQIAMDYIFIGFVAYDDFSQNKNSSFKNRKQFYHVHLEKFLISSFHLIYKFIETNLFDKKEKTFIFTNKEEISDAQKQILNRLNITNDII